MMRNDQVEAALDGLGNDGLGGIGTQQDAGDFGLGVTHLDARIVPFLLQPQGGILFDGAGDFSYLHASFLIL